MKEILNLFFSVVRNNPSREDKKRVVERRSGLLIFSPLFRHFAPPRRGLFPSQRRSEPFPHNHFFSRSLKHLGRNEPITGTIMSIEKQSTENHPHSESIVKTQQRQFEVQLAETSAFGSSLNLYLYIDFEKSKSTQLDENRQKADRFSLYKCYML